MASRIPSKSRLELIELRRAYKRIILGYFGLSFALVIVRALMVVKMSVLGTEDVATFARDP